MQPKEFLYFLDGYLANIPDDTDLTSEQYKTIQDKLNLVFKHVIDPSYTDDKQKQKIMNDIHKSKSDNDNDFPAFNPYDHENPVVRC